MNTKKLSLLLFYFFATENLFAQSSLSKALADQMAAKIMDSLKLSDGQKDSIYAINLQLSDQKARLRSLYKQADSLQIYTQKVEHTRDSLYRLVLSDEKYKLYKRKKFYLISND